MKLTASYVTVRLANPDIFHHALKIRLGQSTMEKVPPELKHDVQTVVKATREAYSEDDWIHASRGTSDRRSVVQSQNRA